MARPSKYKFDDSLGEVGETFQWLAASKADVAKIRNSVTQWARRKGKKVVTRSLVREDGILVTIELVENAATL